MGYECNIDRMVKGKHQHNFSPGRLPYGVSLTLTVGVDHFFLVKTRRSTHAKKIATGIVASFFSDFTEDTVPPSSLLRE